MYNKLFTKILDSSIWLQPTGTRIVWLTFIAVMDESGFVQFASVANVAHRAIVSVEEAQEAIRCLESPDPESSDPEHDGRRVERVPGGWIVLNAEKHRDLVTRAVAREQTASRVRKHREGKLACNGPVTLCNDRVTPSEAYSEAEADVQTGAPAPHESFAAFWHGWPDGHRVAKKQAADQWSRLPEPDRHAAIAEVQWRVLHDPAWQRPREDGRWAIPHPFRYLRDRRFTDARNGTAPVVAAAPRPGAHPEPVYDWDQDWCHHDPPCNSHEWHAVLVAKEQTA